MGRASVGRSQYGGTSSLGTTTYGLAKNLSAYSTAEPVPCSSIIPTYLDQLTAIMTALSTTENKNTAKLSLTLMAGSVSNSIATRT